MGLPPGGPDGKEDAYNTGGPGPISGSGSFPGEGNGYPRQYSCLENSIHRGAWMSTFSHVGSQRARHDLSG